ncbi:MAG: sugar ABC transporter substrate-binding protein [Actinobacteria bacterium]|nr:sugar ABC transporter substrate-binding protein [Actinomycetota bacterium]
MKKSILWVVIIAISLSMVVMFSSLSCKPEEVAETTAAEVTEAETTAAETTAAETEAPAEKFKITILCANFDDKWMSYMHQGMEEYAATIPDIADVTLVDAKNAFETQISQAENAIAQGVDALVLVPLNTIEDSPIVDMCIDAGIPLVSVNRFLKNQDLANCYVGSDSLVAGELEMGYLAEISEGKGKVIIIQGELDHEAAINRTLGFENIMESYPEMEEVARDTCHWMRDESQVLMENWIQSGIEFDIVACNNDEGAIGAILGMQSQGLDPKPYFIGGIDATPDALDFLNKGFLDCTVFQDAYGQGKGGIEAAVNILQGKAVDDIVWIPYELVTPDDYETYKAKWE